MNVIFEQTTVGGARWWCGGAEVARTAHTEAQAQAQAGGLKAIRERKDSA